MARGSRSGGSRRHSGGGRSRSRSGGGRPRSSSRSHSYSSSSSHSYHHNHHHHSHYGGSTYHGTHISTKMFFVIWCIIFLAVFAPVVMESCSNNASISNTVERTKLESGNGFMTNCVIDRGNILSNPTRMETQLKEFWEETGVQPMIVTMSESDNVCSDDDAFDWGCNYYDNYIDQEDVFLCVFFNGRNDNPGEGYVAVVGGYQSDSVMDSLAIETWWNYFDRYWYSDCTYDDLFVNTFVDTGNAIMSVSTNGWDLLIWIIAGVIVVATLAAVVLVVKINVKGKVEKAKADADILNADISKSKVETSTDTLADKYL